MVRDARGPDVGLSAPSTGDSRHATTVIPQEICGVPGPRLQRSAILFFANVVRTSHDRPFAG